MNTDNRKLVRTILLIALICISIWGCFVARRDRVFTFFDEADAALVARNLMRGNGYTTDVIWMWVRDWGSPHHPESIWPLLQSTVAAVSFLIFGPSVFAFKITVVAFFIALLAATYFIGEKIFGPWEGLIAAGIVFCSQGVVSLVGIGSNDVGAAFLYFWAIYALYRSFEDNSSSKWVVWGAALSGLAIHQKFQGVLIVIAYAAWQLGDLKRRPVFVLKRSILYLIALIAVGMPFMIRNYSDFNKISYPESKLVNSLGAAWDSRIQRWRMEIVYYYIYWEHEVPTHDYLLKHRGAKYMYFDRNIFELGRLLKLVLTFKIVSQLPALLGILGIFVAWRERKRWIQWNMLVAVCSISYVIFGHMEERYFVFLYPMFGLFAARFLTWAGRLVKENSRVMFALFIVVWMGFFCWAGRPAWSHSARRTPARIAGENRVIAMCKWLETQLKPDEGIVSFSAPSYAFESERYGACPPNIDMKKFILLADRYKLRYFIAEIPASYKKVFNQPGSQYLIWRQMAQLWVGEGVYGFKLEYQDGDIRVYRIPRPDEVDLNSLPVLPPEPDDFTRLLLPPENGGITEAPPPLDLKPQ